MFKIYNRFKMIHRNRIVEFEKILIALKSLDFKNKLLSTYLTEYDNFMRTNYLLGYQIYTYTRLKKKIHEVTEKLAKMKNPYSHKYLQLVDILELKQAQVEHCTEKVQLYRAKIKSLNKFLFSNTQIIDTHKTHLV